MKILRMKKVIISISILLIVILLTGCIDNKGSIINEDTRLITDMYQRMVEIPVNIDSVAVLGSAARILTYADCTDKITGVTEMDKSNDVNMPYSVVNAELFSDLPSVGSGGSKDVTYFEELVTLSPDVIISNQDEGTINELQERTGIPVIGLSYDGIFSDSVYEAITLVGDIMGKEEHCANLVEHMKIWEDDLNDRTKDIEDQDKPAVYTGAVSYKGPHGFEGTYGEYPPFTAINANNVVDKTGRTGALIIDLESVAKWDPDIIFLNPTNMYLVNQDYKKNPSFYDNLKAVQRGELYSQISYNYNSTNIEIAIADAYYAGKIIFPEQFSDIDIERKADEIFEIMLGTKYYQNLTDAGIGFEKISLGE